LFKIAKIATICMAIFINFTRPIDPQHQAPHFVLALAPPS
jgi:hypothetical protein